MRFPNGQEANVHDKHLTRERALRLAVRTGQAVDLDFVWGVQRREGHSDCFGCFSDACPAHCRWRLRCQAVTGEAVATPWPDIRGGFTTRFGDRPLPVRIPPRREPVPI